MTRDIEVIDAATSVVSKEQSEIRIEIERLKAFREGVRLAQPSPSDDGDPPQVTTELAQQFREKTGPGADTNVSCRDSIVEKIEEISPDIFDILVSTNGFTRRLKRKLLVRTSDSIERRERFINALDVERHDLETARDDLERIRSNAQSLPVCSLNRRSLDEFLDLWEEYDELVGQCEEILDRRQRVMNDPNRNGPAYLEPYSLNEYLYRELDTSYPVLSAIASVKHRIERDRAGDSEGDEDGLILTNRC